MPWLLIVLLIAAGVLILIPWMTFISARRMVGMKIKGGDHPSDRMLYFYSRSCGPCRQMTPLIDRLAEQHTEVIKVDVQTAPDIAQTYRIRATPTTVLVKNDQVLEVVLGSKTEKQLHNLLQKID